VRIEISRVSKAALLLPLLVALLFAAAVASPSNKWRIQISSGADSEGVVVFHLAPVNEPAVDVTVQVAKGTGENSMAQKVRDAMRQHLGKSYKVEVDDGEDVLVKRPMGKASFDLTIQQNTVKGVRITLDKE
jgi:hypothetical protein